MAVRDPGADASRRLAGTRFADVRWVRETGSTNVDVMALARDGEPEGVVVVADHQTSGRGRRGRTWEAPTGSGLMCTVLLRPTAALLGAATMAVAVAAAEAVEAVAGVRAGVKWPNDLVWPGDGTSSDRKLAGMLAEVDWPAASTAADGWSAPASTERLAVAAGLGINVAWGQAMPVELAETAVAIDEIVAPGLPPDRVDLLVGFLGALDRWYEPGSTAVAPAGLPAGPGTDQGSMAVVEAWRARSATLGRRVRVDLGADDVEGTAVDLTPEGHLVVRSDDGESRVLAVGDVVHLRPLDR